MSEITYKVVIKVGADGETFTGIKQRGATTVYLTPGVKQTVAAIEADLAEEVAATEVLLKPEEK